MKANDNRIESRKHGWKNEGFPVLLKIPCHLSSLQLKKHIKQTLLPYKNLKTMHQVNCQWTRMDTRVSLQEHNSCAALCGNLVTRRLIKTLAPLEFINPTEHRDLEIPATKGIRRASEQRVRIAATTINWPQIITGKSNSCPARSYSVYPALSLAGRLIIIDRDYCNPPSMGGRRRGMARTSLTPLFAAVRHD